jgi:hypothetical protein
MWVSAGASTLPIAVANRSNRWARAKRRGVALSDREALSGAISAINAENLARRLLDGR